MEKKDYSDSKQCWKHPVAYNKHSACNLAVELGALAS